MRRTVVLVFAVAACVLAGIVAVGCLGKPQFQCAGATDCLSNNVQGVCQMDGFCSFSDPSCPSGQRYGDLSGPRGGECVPLPPDAMIDAYVHDAYVHDARECFGGSGAYQLCFDMMPPMGNVTLAGALDTTNDARCMPMPASWMTNGQPASCMILGKAITINTVTVTGDRPLVIVGDTISVVGTLDVASHRGQAPGPGAATFGGCTAFPTAPLPNVAGAGGGAGGSFMRKGGDGGNGLSLGGTAPPALTVNPTVLRPGCAGQQGGTGAAATPAGAPGAGGGAVFLTASRISLAASAVINASGAGALAANNFTGGSGGGAGGMIVLHAVEMLTATSGARLIANGGGGSSGASDANAGAPGNDPGTASVTTPAAGGDAAGNQDSPGGDGFAGSTQAERGTNASGQAETGGGGGGGGGFITSNLPIANVASSPTLVVVP